MSSSYWSDIDDIELKFTGIDIGWHGYCSFLDLLLNACIIIDESIHIGI
jgi:hypothetical protein